ARTARTRMRLRRAVLASPAVAALFAFAQQPARASSFYWDADAQGTPGGGSGNWNTTEPRWANSPSSTTYGNWSNSQADDAIFGSSGGSLLVETNNIQVGSMHFTGGNWSILNSAATAGSVALANGGTIETAGDLLLVSTFSGGTANIVKSGAGTLGWYAGSTGMPTGTYDVQGGTLGIKTNNASKT